MYFCLTNLIAMKTKLKFILIALLTPVSVLILSNCGPEDKDDPLMIENRVSVAIKYNNHPDFQYKSTTFDIWHTTSPTAPDTLYIDSWLPNEDYLYFEIIVDDLSAISNDTFEISSLKETNTVWLTHRSAAVTSEVFTNDPSVMPSGKLIIKELDISKKKIRAEFYASMYASSPTFPDKAILTNGIIQNNVE